MRLIVYYLSIYLYISYGTAQTLINRPVKIINVKRYETLGANNTDIVGTGHLDDHRDLWYIFSSYDGSVIIQNLATRRVLDIDHEVCRPGNFIRTYGFHGRINQRFYINSDNTISAACNGSLLFSVKDELTNIIVLTANKSDTSSIFNFLDAYNGDPKIS